jgi:hypothetical protein
MLKKSIGIACNEFVLEQLKPTGIYRNALLDLYQLVF